MTRLFLVCTLVLCLGNKIMAQDFQGVATYESKTQVDFDFGGRQIPEDRKKEILERMKRANEKTYELSFNRTESIFKEEEQLETPGGPEGRRGPRFGGFSGTDGDLYKNIKDRKYMVKTDLFGKIFLIEDELVELEWKLESDTRQIGNYTAFKATAVKTIRRPNMRAIFRRGRNGDNENSETEKEEEFIEKEVQIVAWYTPEIPINQGPASYWGLPGLILAVNDDVTTIVCSKITLNPSEKLEIKAPTKGKKVTQAEYDEIAREKTKEMRENFQNRRRGGGGPGGRS